LDLRTVWVQDSFRRTISVHNVTDREIHVQDIVSSCACTSVEPRSFAIPPGERASVRLALNLGGQSPEEVMAPTRLFLVRLMPRIGDSPADLSSDSLPPCVWELRGEVRSAFWVSPSTLDFGASLVRGVDFVSRVVKVTCHQPLADLQAKCDEPHVRLNVHKGDPEGRAFQIEVIPEVALPVGKHAFKVEMTAVSPRGEAVFGSPLNVLAQVFDDVTVEPSALLFGLRNLGEVCWDTVVLRTRTGRPFQVRKVEIASSDVEVSPWPEGAPAGAQTFRVSTKVSRAGAHETQVRFLVEVSGLREVVRAPLRVIWHGGTAPVPTEEYGTP
jgi:hypothetical protein